MKTGKIEDPEESARRRREERERQEREQEEKAAEERKQKMLREKVLAQNARYEYTTAIVPDDKDGAPNAALLNGILAKHAESGWRLHSVTTNELGRNSTPSGAGGMTVGTNATIDVTVLIFERCIKPASFENA